MLDSDQLKRWNEVNSLLETEMAKVKHDPPKSQEIENIRARLAWALDQYESGLYSKQELLRRMDSEVSEKFQEILGSKIYF